MNRKLYNILQWTWGIPQTLAGAGLYLKHRKKEHFDYRGAKVTAWDRSEGISLGKFIFVPRKSSHGRTTSVHTDMDTGVRVDRFLLDHEYGHTIQSLILGPAYLLLVGAPSMVWNRSKFFNSRRKKIGKSYYSAVFERTASELGERAADKERREE